MILFKPIHIWALVVIFTGACPIAHGEAKDPLPSASSIINNLLSRVNIEKNHLKDAYDYRQQSIRKEYKKNGSLKSQEEKIYQISFENGKRNRVLIEIDGKVLSKKGVDTQKRKYRQVYRRYSKKDENSPSNDGMITQEIIDRFDIQVIKEIQFQGRTNYLLTFHSKPDLKESKLTDRLLNQLEGEIWIDKEEFELSKLEFHLRKKIKFFAGLLGSIEKFSFTLLQTRLEKGVWVDKSTDVYIKGHRFFTTWWFRNQTVSNQFKRTDRKKP